MKRIALFFGIAAAMVASCSIQDENFETPQQDDVIFYASFEQPSEGTRVYANEELLLRWTADDRVSIFNKLTYNQQYKFTGETGDNAGGFRKVDTDEFVTGNTISHVVSVYPYQEGTKISESEVLTLTLPAEQHYAENTFGLGANTMVSVSEDNVLQYKNVGGYLRLSLYGEGVSVSSITLKGNNGEKLAGKATVTMPLDGTPSAVLANDATDEITLICDSPVALGATTEESKDFWFVVPPVTFSRGFTVTIITSNGSAIDHSTSNAVEITRSKLSKMASFKVVEETPSVVSVNCSFSDITISKCQTIVSLTFNKEIGSGVVVGILYSVDENPVSSENALTKSFNYTGTQNIDLYFLLTTLEMNTEYYCVPFAIVGGEYIYGNIRSFKTQNIVSVTEGDYVDMGAGILWASSNLGAKKPTEAGDRYAWGELTTKESYSLDNYTYYLGNNYIDIGNNIVNTDYDVCRSKLGNGYRLPSVSELSHLFTDNSYAWTEYDGVVGVVIQSEKNGNSIFIPYLNTNLYSGYHTLEGSSDGYTAHYSGLFAGFMTGQLSTNTGTFGSVYCLMICPEISSAPANYKYNQVWYNGFLAREKGQSVRAVYDPSCVSVAIPEAVDLGLPSGIKWASFNLGASKPEEYGDYYAWGETEPYYSSLDPLTWKEGKEGGYCWATYKWCRGTNNAKLTKYCSDPSYGYIEFTDERTVLDLVDDAAYVNLGGKWRMPTYDEFTELREKCTWEWTLMNGINGQIVTGPNENSIFLPATGCRWYSGLTMAGGFGFYWSSSLDTGYSYDALHLIFGSDDVSQQGSLRYHGLSVRPVCD